ncbi:MAG TPA: hypothetical protein EYN69_02420 [Flavobacteriales bacterium]|nr:hypothetical protein [Flavobacteriales bacterium]
MAAGFNINRFRGALQGGGARPNLFQVSVAGNDMGEEFSYMCKGASLPGTDIGSIDVPYFGRTIKVPGNRTYPEWTATVINDEDFIVHQRVINWLENINSTQPNLQTGQLGQSSALLSDITIDQKRRDGTSVKEVSLKNAWPSSLAAIDLAWDSNDAIEEFTVTFQYDWWEVIST